MGVFTLKILLIWSISDFPGKRGFWVRSSPNMQPTDHMSTAVEYSCREKNKHRGSPQKQKVDGRPGTLLRWICVWKWMCSDGLLDLCRLAVQIIHCKTQMVFQWYLVSYKPNTSQMLEKCLSGKPINQNDVTKSMKKITSLCVVLAIVWAFLIWFLWSVAVVWTLILTLAPSSSSGDLYHRVTTTGV